MVHIFISHSSKDKWLIDHIASILKLIPVEPYLAEIETPTPTSLPQKLSDAIATSDAVFVFWTSNVAENQSTRDVVNWEISAAYHMNPRKPIYVFTQKDVEVPTMLDYTTVYANFDPLDPKTLIEMLQKVQNTASSCIKKSKVNVEKSESNSNVLDLIDGRRIAILCQTPRPTEFLRQQYNYWQSQSDWVVLGGYGFDDYMKRLEKEGFLKYQGGAWAVSKEALDYIAKYHGG